MNRIRILTIRYVATLAAMTALIGRAAEPAADHATEGKAYEGRLVALDATDRDVKVKRFLFSKSFHLGDHCAVAVGDKKDVPLSELRPGQRVRVCYRDVSGVLVASQLEQLPMVWHGRIAQLDASQRSLTVQDGHQAKSFTISDGCKFIISGDREGRLDALRIGERVTVVYELPATGPQARRVEQTSETFTGTLTAVDAERRMVRAKRMIGDKTFQLAKDCQIVTPNKTRADLKDLRLGQKWTFSFESVDGVNIVTCISSALEQPKTTASAASN